MVIGVFEKLQQNPDNRQILCIFNCFKTVVVHNAFWVPWWGWQYWIYQIVFSFRCLNDCGEVVRSPHQNLKPIWYSEKFLREGHIHTKDPSAASANPRPLKLFSLALLLPQKKSWGHLRLVIFWKCFQWLVIRRSIRTRDCLSRGFTFQNFRLFTYLKIIIEISYAPKIHPTR